MTATLRIDSPIGELTLTASDAALTGVFFPTSRHGKPPAPNGETSDVLAEARRQLEEYFSGTRQTFDLPLEPTGTPFQLQVWELLRRIPYGATTSYGALAKQLGDPTASRAVGAANGQNPIPIIVPCHRVIGSNGDLTGFGGGIERKRWLLKHEGALLL
jgi:methylated-DNA-[protein]-cysteine S-methyltransferase